MKERLQQRLEELKAEFAKGQKRLNELENETSQIRNTLIRISGAIQVLEEELGEDGHRDISPDVASNEN